MLEKIAERTDRARIITKAEVTGIIMNGPAVVGCDYKKGGATFQEYGP